MRLVAIVALTISGAVGCAQPPVTEAPVAPEGAELQVRLYPAIAGSEMKYYVSEPAFITLFELAPDGRARLIYPYYREKQTRSVAGLSPLRPRGDVPPLFYDSTRPSFYVYASHPTYLYLIASRSPLPLETIERSLRIVPASFSAADISENLDRLEKLVVGGLPDDEWSSALLPIFRNASGFPSMTPPYSPKIQSRAARRP